MTTTKPTPAPGSDAAIAIGCICPVLDNGHGVGARITATEIQWWVNADCPVHGTGWNNEDQTQRR